MGTIRRFNFNGSELSVVKSGEEIWFKRVEVAGVLIYENR